MPITSLPIYNESYRPSAAWQVQLQEQQACYQQLLPLTAATQVPLQQHLLIEQVWHNLQLSEVMLSREQVARLILSKLNPARSAITPADTERSNAAAAIAEVAEFVSPETCQLVGNLVNTLQYLQDLASTHRPDTPVNLTVNRLAEIHTRLQEGLSNDGGQLRAAEGKSLAPGHDPLPAELLPKILANALDWFAAPSVAELHPLEQAWLVHLRLMELQPFDHHSGLVTRLAVSLYLQRAGLPPLIISAADREIYNYALNNALQMITQPGVEFLAQSTMRVYRELIALATLDNEVK